MNRERKTAVATLLFAGMTVLSFIYDIYGRIGVVIILGIILMEIGMLSIEGEKENDQGINIYN